MTTDAQTPSPSPEAQAGSTTDTGAPAQATATPHRQPGRADRAARRAPAQPMAHFNRERIPERNVHAKGGGAYGTFVTTGDVSAYTRAALFQPGVETEMLARFSTVAGEQGSRTPGATRAASR